MLLIIAGRRRRRRPPSPKGEDVKHISNGMPLTLEIVEVISLDNMTRPGALGSYSTGAKGPILYVDGVLRTTLFPPEVKSSCVGWSVKFHRARVLA